MDSTRDIVLFRLQAGVSGERSREILAEVAAWPGIAQTGPLHPGSPLESLRRSCVATLAPGAVPAPVLGRLNGIREVESSSAPEPRRLVA